MKSAKTGNKRERCGYGGDYQEIVAHCIEGVRMRKQKFGRRVTLFALMAQNFPAPFLSAR